MTGKYPAAQGSLPGRKNHLDSVTLLLLLAVFFLTPAASSKSLLPVSSGAWEGLTAGERSIIQNQYFVETSSDESYALIIDNQSIDRSTGGTYGGMVLGEAVASATYIDKSFDAGNYSAKTHLGMMLLGGLLGSAIDKSPTQKYHTRYTVKSRNGSISSHDVISSDPFRHPVGVCVRVPELAIAQQQSLCNETTESFRLKHSLSPQSSLARDAPRARKTSTAISENNKSSEKIAPQSLVMCRVGTLAPVNTTALKCKAINGRVTQ